MKVFVSVDMEGVAGVNTPRQVLRGNEDYTLARQLMTDEASAAVAGAFAGGASAVTVGDAHGDMSNLLPDRLDRRAVLVHGSPKGYLGMMGGIDDSVDVCLFVGYHARAGTQGGCLEHTFAGTVVWDLRVNGESWAELDFNAAIAGTRGAPVALVSGDDKVCAYATERLPGVTAVQVKEGLGRNVAAGVHPAEARQRIEAAAADAVKRAGELAPFVPEPPFRLEMDVLLTSMADACAVLPGGERTGARTVAFNAATLDDVFRCRYVWTGLAASQAPRYAS